MFELVPPESLLDAEQQQSLLYSSDLELGETTRRSSRPSSASSPSRVVLDSLSEIRLLAQSSLRYRRQILAIKHYFARHGATVLLLDDLTSETPTRRSTASPTASSSSRSWRPNYGAERRRMRVVKYRGQAFRGGYHDFTIKTGGSSSSRAWSQPSTGRRSARRQIRAATRGSTRCWAAASSRDRARLMLGPAGTGKSTFITAVRRGRHRARRKGRPVHLRRGARPAVRRGREAMGIRPRSMQRVGSLHIEQVDAAELSPGEFAHRVRQRVEVARARQSSSTA